MALPDDWASQHVKEQCARIRRSKSFKEAVAASIWMLKPIDLGALGPDARNEMADAFQYICEHTFGDGPTGRQEEAAP